MFGFSAFSETSISATAEAALPLVEIPVGSIGAAPIGVYAIGQSSSVTQQIGAEVSTDGSATAEVPGTATAPPEATVSASAVVSIVAPETSTVSPEPVSSGSAISEVQATTIALTPAESLATGAAEATFSEVIDVGIAPLEGGLAATANATPKPVIALTALSPSSITTSSVTSALPTAATTPPEPTVSASATGAMAPALVVEITPLRGVTSVGEIPLQFSQLIMQPPTASADGEAQGVPISLTALTTASPVTTQAGTAKATPSGVTNVTVQTPAVYPTASAGLLTGLPTLVIGDVRAFGYRIDPSYADPDYWEYGYAEGDINNGQATSDLPQLQITPVEAGDTVVPAEIKVLNVQPAEAFAETTASSTVVGPAALQVIAPTVAGGTSNTAFSLPLSPIVIPQSIGPQSGFTVSGDANVAAQVAAISTFAPEPDASVGATVGIPFTSTLFVGFFNVNTSGEGVAGLSGQAVPGPLIVSAASAVGSGTATTTTLSLPTLETLQPAVDYELAGDASAELAPYYLETGINIRPAVVNTNPSNTNNVLVTTDASRSSTVSQPKPIGENTRWYLENTAADGITVENRYAVEQTFDSSRVLLTLLRFDWNEDTAEFDETVVDTAIYSWSIYVRDHFPFAAGLIVNKTADGNDDTYLASVPLRTNNGSRYFYGSAVFNVDLESESVSYRYVNFETGSGAQTLRRNFVGKYLGTGNYRFAVRIDTFTYSHAIVYVNGDGTTSILFQSAQLSGDYTNALSSSHQTYEELYPTLNQQVSNYLYEADKTVEIKNAGANAYPPLTVPDFNARAIPLGPEATAVAPQPRPGISVVGEALPNLSLSIGENLAAGAGIEAVSQRPLYELQADAPAHTLLINNNVQVQDQLTLSAQSPENVALAGVSEGIIGRLETAPPSAAVDVLTPTVLAQADLAAPAVEASANAQSGILPVNEVTTSPPSTDAGVFVETLPLPTLEVSPDGSPFAANGDIGVIAEVPAAATETTVEVNAAIATPSVSVTASTGVEYALLIQQPGVFAFQQQAIPDFLVVVENEVRFIEVAEELRISEVEPEIRIIEVA